MKKYLLKILSFVLTIGSFFVFADNVKAAHVIISFRYVPNVYYVRTMNGRTDSHQFINYKLDGKDAYCIEPGVESNDWDYYTYDLSHSPYSTEINMQMQLIGHYGYDYPNHQTEKYRMATQALIWELVKENLTIEFYTKVNGQGNHIDITAEKNEIMRLVNNHTLRPSFNGNNYDTTYNQQLVLEDTNNVLNNFEVLENAGNTVSISGNKLYITPNSMNNTTIELKRKYYDNETTIIYLAENGKAQSLGRFRANDPLYTTIKLNTTGGTISIEKKDAETNSNTPQGNAKLSGAKYGVYDSNNTLLTEITTNSQGKGTSELLNKLGDFYIKEITAPEGYQLDTNSYSFTISGDNLNPSIVVKDNVIKGKIKATKYDSDNNSCTTQGKASLKGAKYGIYNSSNTLVETLTIGDDCTATSSNLPYGNYTVKETNAGTGYNLDSTVYNANIRENGATTNITSKDKVIKGKVKITKYDIENNSCRAQGEAELKNAKYSVYDENNNVVDTIIIGTDCSGISKELPYGNYKVKEANASIGYELDTNTYDANITSTNTINLTSKEQVIKGKIKITKVDSENKSCTPQGEALLKGAKFEIKDKNNIVVDTLTIGENCIATSKDLPYGEYSIIEKESSKGYYLNEGVSRLFIKKSSNEETILLDVEVQEDVIKNEFIFNKFYGNQSTGFIYSEKDAVFDIINLNGKTVGTVKTDEEGIAKINLPYGTYQVKQVKGLKEYKLMQPFDITVDENTKLTQIKNIKNGEITAKLKVIKIDADTKEQINIKGFKFKIKNTDTDDFVCQTTDKIICEYETNEEGILITPLPLFGGNYELIEIESKPNYLLSDEKIKFKINDDTEFKEDLIFGNIVEIKYENKEVKGTVEVYKNGEVFNGNSISLNNVKFGLYKSDDTLIKEITTDINGYFKIENLSLGKYYIKELECPSTYILDDKKYEFELAYQDDKTPIIYKEFTINNYLKKGDLEFSKTDLATSEGIPNTIIEIYNDNTNEIIFTKTTDKNGKVTIKNLPIGKYYIKEKEAATGYLISNEKVSFEIKKNGEIVKAKMTNKKITSTLEITKTDISTDEPLPNTLIEIYTSDDKLLFSEKTDEEGKIIIPDIPYGDYYFIEKEAPIGYVINDEKMQFKVREDGEIIKSTIQDRKIIGGIEITKIDVSTDEPLPNTLFEIYNENDELLFSERTDELGKVYIPELSYGTYYILEKEAPDGYLLNDEKMYFEIKIDGEIVKATITDEKIIIEVPKTDQNKDYKLILYASIILLLGIGIVLYGKNKNKKKK